MNIIKILKIRKLNKKLINMKKQSKRKKCCESCKFCILTEFLIGHNYYTCLLNEPKFLGTPKDIYYHNCDRYEPCREFKKYLKFIGDE